jgi:hypothetical protein
MQVDPLWPSLFERHGMKAQGKSNPQFDRGNSDILQAIV